MSLFDKRNPDVDARANSDLDRLARGGLPAGAERRLNALRQNGTFFTSNLSVNELALAATEGVRPLGQVMGSTVYHVGWQYAFEPKYGTHGSQPCAVSCPPARDFASAAGSAASGSPWSDWCPSGAPSVYLG